jgi:hypothetical protein
MKFEMSGELKREVVEAAGNKILLRYEVTERRTVSAMRSTLGRAASFHNKASRRLRRVAGYPSL